MGPTNTSLHIPSRLLLGGGFLHSEWIRADPEVFQNTKAYLCDWRHIQEVYSSDDSSLGGVQSHLLRN